MYGRGEWDNYLADHRLVLVCSTSPETVVEVDLDLDSHHYNPAAAADSGGHCTGMVEVATLTLLEEIHSLVWL